jgi:hypothetical protein
VLESAISQKDKSVDSAGSSERKPLKC